MNDAPESPYLMLRAAQVGDLIQLDPEQHPGWFGGHFMLVTSLSGGGRIVVGYVPVMLPDGGQGQAYYRAKAGTFAVIGSAVWVSSEDVPVETT